MKTWLFTPSRRFYFYPVIFLIAGCSLLFVYARLYNPASPAPTGQPSLLVTRLVFAPAGNAVGYSTAFPPAELISENKNGVWSGLLILLSVTPVILATGSLILWFRRRRRKTWLQYKGQLIEAEILGVVQKKTVQAGGFSPYVIQCQWLDIGKNRVYVFESDPVWYHPGSFLPAGSLRVLIDPSNPRNYWVDLSFLPASALGPAK